MTSIKSLTSLGWYLENLLEFFRLSTYTRNFWCALYLNLANFERQPSKKFPFFKVCDQWNSTDKEWWRMENRREKVRTLNGMNGKIWEKKQWKINTHICYRLHWQVLFWIYMAQVRTLQKLFCYKKNLCWYVFLNSLPIYSKRKCLTLIISKCNVLWKNGAPTILLSRSSAQKWTTKHWQVSV